MTGRLGRDGLAALTSMLLVTFAMSTTDARPAKPAAREKLLTITQGGCHFRPAITAIVERVHAKVPDGEPYKPWEPVRFAFGPLHGVGVVAEANDDFSGEELYFLEDRAALKRVLSGIGLHVAADENVVAAAKFVDGGHGMVSVGIHAIDARDPDPHFPAARSWLSYGAL